MATSRYSQKVISFFFLLSKGPNDHFVFMQILLFQRNEKRKRCFSRSNQENHKTGTIWRKPLPLSSASSRYTLKPTGQPLNNLLGGSSISSPGAPNLKTPPTRCLFTSPLLELKSISSYQYSWKLENGQETRRASDLGPSRI